MEISTMNWLRFDFVFENSRHEKRLWFMTLLLGTCMLYSTRTSMPLLTPAVSSELRWSKTESGTVLSSFFWGYTVTQVRKIWYPQRTLNLETFHELSLQAVYTNQHILYSTSTSEKRKMNLPKYN